MSLKSLYRLRKPTDSNTLHVSPHNLVSYFISSCVCLSELPSYSLTCTSVSHLPPFLSVSPVSVFSCFIFCPSFALIIHPYFFFSHIPVTSSVPHHHLDSHSSALYHLWKRTFFFYPGSLMLFFSTHSLPLILFVPLIHIQFRSRNKVCRPKKTKVLLKCLFFSWLCHKDAVSN